jgi:pimeloyl-ACP methyl ester carboxylesterase
MSTYLADQAPIHHIDVPSGKLAYRRFGRAGAGIPIVLLTRFRGTMDHWDPAFLDALAARREVIVFDNAGVGYSTGTVPGTITGMAEVVAEFLSALGLGQVDLVAWSMGGMIGQIIALDRPDLVRKLVIAGSGPGGVPGNPGPDPRVPEHAMREQSIDDDFLFLFYPDTEAGRRAGLESLRRIDTRLLRSGQDVGLEGRLAQLSALTQWSSGKGSAWDRLDELRTPVLIANGAHDVMEHAYQTYAMGQRIPDSKVIIYGDAGHAFLFQHIDDFAKEIHDFLGSPASAS